MPTLIHLAVVAANPGYKIVGIDDPDLCRLELSDDIVAWRIETWKTDDGSLLSVTQPLTAKGQMQPDAVGVACPDGSVRTCTGIYESLNAADKGA